MAGQQLGPPRNADRTASVVVIGVEDQQGIDRGGTIHVRMGAWWSLELLANGEAHREGLRLLKENLTPRQRHQLEVFNYFDVVGGVTA